MVLEAIGDGIAMIAAVDFEPVADAERLHALVQERGMIADTPPHASCQRRLASRAGFGTRFRLAS